MGLWTGIDSSVRLDRESMSKERRRVILEAGNRATTRAILISTRDIIAINSISCWQVIGATLTKDRCSHGKLGSFGVGHEETANGYKTCGER